MFPCEMEMFRNQFDVVCALATPLNESRMERGSLQLLSGRVQIAIRFEGVKEPRYGNVHTCTRPAQRRNKILEFFSLSDCSQYYYLSEHMSGHVAPSSVARHTAA